MSNDSFLDFGSDKISTDTPVTDSEMPKGTANESVGQVAELASLRARRKSKTPEDESLSEKPKKKRGRKPGSKNKPKTPQLTPEQVDTLCRPLFMFGNVVMESRDIRPFNDEEIKAGIAAWYPILDHYMPEMDKYGMWIPPVLWTGGVVVSRLIEQQEKRERKNLDKVIKNDTSKTIADIDKEQVA